MSMQSFSNLSGVRMLRSPAPASTFPDSQQQNISMQPTNPARVLMLNRKFYPLEIVNSNNKPAVPSLVPTNGPANFIPQSAVRPPFRRQRKSNFSNAEVEILVREVATRRDVLFGSRGRSSMNGLSKSSEKMTKWREIAAAVNSADYGEKRTVREVRKKWENVVSSFRRKIRQPNLLTSLIGAGRCPADEALACANAYCGSVPLTQSQGGPPPPQLTLQMVHQEEEEEEDVYETDPEELFIQPEVQIDEDEGDAPMDFSNSGVKVEALIGKGEEEAFSPKVETIESLQEPMDMREIEMQKLQVMRELLEVESKRLKVERKRLKVERMRLQIETQKMGSKDQ